MGLIARAWSKYKVVLPVAVAYALAGALAASAIWGNRGLVHLWRLEAQLAELERTALQLQRGNSALRARLRRLRSDTNFLEQVIRERLGWVREGEILYRFPPASAGNRRAVPAEDGD